MQTIINSNLPCKLFALQAAFSTDTLSMIPAAFEVYHSFILHSLGHCDGKVCFFSPSKPSFQKFSYAPNSSCFMLNKTSPCWKGNTDLSPPSLILSLYHFKSSLKLCKYIKVLKRPIVPTHPLVLYNNTKKWESSVTPTFKATLSFSHSKLQHKQLSNKTEFSDICYRLKLRLNQQV